MNILDHCFFQNKPFPLKYASEKKRFLVTFSTESDFCNIDIFSCPEITWS